MNNYKAHQKLLKDVMISMQKKFPGAKIFERHVGYFRYLRSNGVIKINHKGMCDLWVIYKGRLIELEIKTGKARQTKDQKRWEEIITEAGFEYYVIRSIEDLDRIPL